jgi:DNA modification methylase
MTVLVGDCREVMQTMADNSVDAIVTDPPYELGFMGKSWDSTGVAYDVAVWQECLRVLKPGAHLLAFGGSRTYHRLAVAIEDAGFQIRDQIMWVYGSGFPKSLNISKAIDKNNGEVDRVRRFTAWMRTTGLKARQIDEITGTNMGGHYLTAASQPAIPTAELWSVLRSHCGDVPEWVNELVARIEAEREVIGQRDVPVGHAFAGEVYGGDSSNKTVNETAPATDKAKQWDGWGTALKPAHEPIVMARKPLIGTVAENVLTYGVGGINIDGSRIGNQSRTYDLTMTSGNFQTTNGGKNQKSGTTTVTGRFPANFIHDGSDEVLELFPSVKADGSAARFFYCAKASKKDRNEGLDGFAEKREADRIISDGVGGDNPRNRSNTPKLNHHPTVKPTDLMRYLCRLVTPPNGLVLDPFTGSGSTGKAATLEGFSFIGIEQSTEYAEIANARINHAKENK